MTARPMKDRRNTRRCRPGARSHSLFKLLSVATLFGSLAVLCLTSSAIAADSASEPKSEDRSGSSPASSLMCAMCAPEPSKNVKLVGAPRLMFGKDGWIRRQFGETKAEVGYDAVGRVRPRRITLGYWNDMYTLDIKNVRWSQWNKRGARGVGTLLECGSGCGARGKARIVLTGDRRFHCVKQRGKAMRAYHTMTVIPLRSGVDRAKVRFDSMSNRVDNCKARQATAPAP